MRFVLFIISVAVLLGVVLVGGITAYPNKKLQRSATNLVPAQVVPTLTAEANKTLQLDQLQFETKVTVTQTPTSCSKAAFDLLIDTSSSMENDGPDGRPRLESVKDAIRNFASQLQSDNILGMQKFSTVPRSIMSVDLFSVNRTEVGKAIGELAPENETNTAEGLKLARDRIVAARTRFSGYTWHLLLITDGSPDDDPVPVADQIKGLGIKIITIGFDLGSTELNPEQARQLLKDLASTQGDFYEPSPNEMKNIYNSISASLCSR